MFSLWNLISSQTPLRLKPTQRRNSSTLVKPECRPKPIPAPRMTTPMVQAVISRHVPSNHSRNHGDSGVRSVPPAVQPKILLQPHTRSLLLAAIPLKVEAATKHRTPEVGSQTQLRISKADSTTLSSVSNTDSYSGKLGNLGHDWRRTGVWYMRQPLEISIALQPIYSELVFCPFIVEPCLHPIHYLTPAGEKVGRHGYG